MKRTIALAFLAASLVSLATTHAHAQEVRFKVPFDFVVRDHVLPAGTYAVSQKGENSILIRNQNGHSGVFTVVNAADVRSRAGGNLLFVQYGKQYFLHEVHCNMIGINNTLPASRLEKRVRVEQAQLAHSQTVAALHDGEK